MYIGLMCVLDMLVLEYFGDVTLSRGYSGSVQRRSVLPLSLIP